MMDKVHFRWSCSWIDLRGDGRFAKEMIKGDVKKILQRDTRRRLKKELAGMIIDGRNTQTLCR